METDLQDETPIVVAEGGTVIIDGLPGVALTLSAEIAQELAQRLAAAAVVAFGQRSVSKVSVVTADAIGMGMAGKDVGAASPGVEG